MEHRTAVKLLLVGVALAMTGCAITSDGLELRPSPRSDATRVTFDWQGADTGSGTLSGVLADGREFRGDYVQHHAGEILANLATPDGERMRCLFTLDDASRGVSGGAGQCEIPGGRTIDARFK
jgi:hypothetical protein